MNPQTMEKVGTTKNKSTENKSYKRHLFSWMLCHPICVVIYILFCRYAYELCMYGGVKRRGSVVVVCVLLFIIYLIVYIIRCVHVKVYKNQEPDTDKIWFYGFTKNRVYLFDSKCSYYEKNVSNEEKDFFKLKFKKFPIYRHHFMKIPVYILFVTVTAMTAFGIYKSSQPYNGKLAWFLEEVKNSEYIVLEHNNLYRDGIKGIFTDINRNAFLPENLTIDGVFNLHFEKDGTIKSFHMMLKGYDENLQYVDSYLVSYPSSWGRKIRFEKQSYNTAPGYDATKAMDALLESGEVLPYKGAIAEWDEEEYGVYYLGSRTWKRSDENLFVLKDDGNVSPVHWGDKTEITGFSISVFCPDNSDIVPKRYMVGAENVVESEEETFTEDKKEMNYPVTDYGKISEKSGIFSSVNGESIYRYNVGCFYFDNRKYRKINKTLETIYCIKEEEFKDYCEENVDFYQWTLNDLVYVGEDYVEVEFLELIYTAGNNGPLNQSVSFVIDVNTGWCIGRNGKIY